jgi:plasmid stability protein
MIPNRKSFTLALPGDVFEELRSRAEIRGSSLGQIAREILIDALGVRRKQRPRRKEKSRQS